MKLGYGSNVDRQASLTITGNAVVRDTLPDLVNPQSNTTFDCTFSIDGHSPSQPAFLICGVGGGPNGEVDGSEVEIDGPAGGLISRLDSSNGRADGSAYLVVNYTKVASSNATFSQDWKLSSYLGRGPWMDLNYTFTAFGNITFTEMAVSMCFDAL